MWIVFKRKEFMTGLFRKFICLLIFCFIFISCWSSPSGSSPNSSQQPVERQLKRYSTYQTSLTNEDIMKSFVNEVRTYLQRYDSYGCYYLVQFGVHQESEKQNYAWATDTYEKRYQWGTVYEITLYIANAWFDVRFCNTSFSNGGQDAREIVTTRFGTVGGNRIRQHIVSTATSMFEASEMVLKLNNRNYSDESKTVFVAEILRILF
jgi:hypothetical protein